MAMPAVAGGRKTGLLFPVNGTELIRILGGNIRFRAAEVSRQVLALFEQFIPWQRKESVLLLLALAHHRPLVFAEIARVILLIGRSLFDHGRKPVIEVFEQVLVPIAPIVVG